MPPTGIQAQFHLAFTIFHTTPPTGTPHLCTGCRITKLPQSYQGRSSEMVVNMEWGDFKSPCLPTLPEDIWVDCSSPNPGE